MAGVTAGPGAVTLGEEDRAAAVAAVKAQLRVSVDAEDALIAAFAESALGLAEQFTGQALIARAMTAALRPTRAWQVLPAMPVRAVAAVSGTAGVLGVADYAIDIDADGGGWVRLASGDAASAAFTAGIADAWSALPAPIRHGVAMLAAHLFEDRGGTTQPPAAVTALWRPFRRMPLAQAAHA